MEINRNTLVRRHNPVIQSFDKYDSLTIGNGEFAMTVDATGLQTFPDIYSDGGVPLGTMSNWGWHEFPNPNQYTQENFPLTYLSTFSGREIGFPYSPWLQKKDPHTEWLRNNPHRLHLGLLQFRFLNSFGEIAAPSDIHIAEQVLDLWTGVITSRFTIFDSPVVVTTLCHPQRDMIAVHVESALLLTEQLHIQIHFPYGSPYGAGVDWNSSEQHSTTVQRSDENHQAIFERCLDDTRYFVYCQGSHGSFENDLKDAHLFYFKPLSTSTSVDFVCHFTPNPTEDALPQFAKIREQSESYWSAFWKNGAAVELIESKDERAKELERRIILSQYLTAVNSSGALPPQESGLIHNSWSGKFHLEMHWWHSVHFALWGRIELLENSLSWYQSLLPNARKLAETQGYKGARWPKCVGPDGINAPCYIEPFLIWQQPHPIYYAELIYRQRPDGSTLQTYQDIVFESAQFMASFAEWDAKNQRYVLGPPMAPAQEIYDHTVTMNSPLELTYWRYGLEIAQTWRERLGMGRNETWDHILKHLSALPMRDGLYVGTETFPDTFTNENFVKDHPTMVASYGMLPGQNIDKEAMRNTLHTIMQVWNWPHSWGWDYPMLAMTAARLGEGNLAIDCLLLQKGKNTYLPNGHNFQHGGLPVYLPGNGGLLTAVALMAAGWDGAPEVNAPGFPQDGSWVVRHEGLKKMP